MEVEKKVAPFVTRLGIFILSPFSIYQFWWSFWISMTFISLTICLYFVVSELYLISKYLSLFWLCGFFLFQPISNKCVLSYNIIKSISISMQLSPRKSCWCYHLHCFPIPGARRGDKMTSWRGLALRINGPLWGKLPSTQMGSLHTIPIMWRFGASIVVSLNKLFKKTQSSRWGLEKLQTSCDVIMMRRGCPLHNHFALCITTYYLLLTTCTDD